MKPIITVYSEGRDTKVAVLIKDDEGIKVSKIFTLGGKLKSSRDSQTSALSNIDIDGMSGDIQLDDSSGAFMSKENDSSDIGIMAAALSSYKLPMCEFIPVMSEPGLNIHYFEGYADEDKDKFLKAVVEQVRRMKGALIDSDMVDVFQLPDKSYIALYIDGDIQSYTLINSLAVFNGRRYYKVPTIKSAELSMAYLVGKSHDFFPEDFSLILYTAKEYSKLIFLEGSKLKHIGPTLDIGTTNLHTYDVYFSKILLEMENGGIPRLDNIILCGEDKSENLVLSFYGAFPEANVTELSFDRINIKDLSPEEKDNISSFTIPISAGLEYFHEEDKIYKGIRILPNFIKENQKLIQVGWHTWVTLVALFFISLFFVFTAQKNSLELKELKQKIDELTSQKVANQAILADIEDKQNRIAAFDETVKILDAASDGAEVWTNGLSDLSTFIERKRNFWVNRLESKGSQVTIEGYALNRTALTEFAEYNNSSELKNILYDPLRSKNTYTYILNYQVKQNKMVP